MFLNVPGCSGMFHVPGFIDGPLVVAGISKTFLLIIRALLKTCNFFFFFLKIKRD